MSISRGAKLGIVLGVAGALAGMGATAGMVWKALRPPPPRPALVVRLDTAGPFMIVASDRARQEFVAAIAKAQALHPDAESSEFDPADLGALQATLRQGQPRYALVFLLPDELDVNFAWRWLTMTAGLDDDPFVDVRTGFITGRTPEAAAAFVERIAAAVEGRLQPPGAFVDNLGPVEAPAAPSFSSFRAAPMIPVLGERLNLLSVSHAKGQFGDDRLGSLAGAGLVHFGGHGHPDRIDDGLSAAQIAKLDLAPSIVFNGACYTGVTHRWYDQAGGPLAERNVPPDESFCLRMLETGALAYLAAVHPDHGMPVYQEMEHLAWTGDSLGEAIKHTHDGVVIGAGGKLPAFETLEDGTFLSAWTPADIMLKGTASRVLFGDPALVPCEGFASPPFTIVSTLREGMLSVTATVASIALKSTFTDTYYNDLNPQAPFNDRALVIVDLPAKWTGVNGVEVGSVRSAGEDIPHRLVGYAVEHDQGRARLHVQVDVPAHGFQQSPLRSAGATVEFIVEPE
jgi:hypothetical protein